MAFRTTLEKRVMMSRRRYQAPCPMPVDQAFCSKQVTVILATLNKPGPTKGMLRYSSCEAGEAQVNGHDTGPEATRYGKNMVGTYK